MTDRVYIIHNTDRIDRYRILMNELMQQGIDNYELMPSMHDDKFAYVGINKAHKNVIKYAKDNQLDSIIVAEDDVLFTSNKSYQYFLDNEPKEYDIYLGGIYLGEINNGITEKFTGLSIYKCHSRFYDTFLNADPNEQIDIALSHKGIFKVCNPMIARQHNGYSDNEKRYMNYDFMFANKNMLKHI